MYNKMRVIRKTFKSELGLFLGDRISRLSDRIDCSILRLHGCTNLPIITFRRWDATELHFSQNLETCFSDLEIRRQFI